MAIKLKIITKSYLSTVIFSPDCNEKPFESEPYFFLVCQSDQRKLLANLRKKGLAEKAWNGKREIASKKKLTGVKKFQFIN